MPDRKTDIEPKVTIRAVVRHADGSTTDYGVLEKAEGKDNKLVAAVKRMFGIGEKDDG